MYVISEVTTPIHHNYIIVSCHTCALQSECEHSSTVLMIICRTSVLCAVYCKFVYDCKMYVVCCRCVAALTSLGGLVAGAVLWPALADSLSHIYKILPGEMVLAGIIHNVQLVVSIEIPALYMALEVNTFREDS